jgi:6-phosphogluconolactonase
MSRSTLKYLICGLFCSLPTAAAWADGAVYAMTNALDNNQVLVYHRANNGNLNPSPVQTIATGGGGSGLQLVPIDSLGSAGAIQLDPDHRLLFVVNTESAAENAGIDSNHHPLPYNADCRQGTITSFRVGHDGTLTFADRVFSGGLFPNSLTVRKRDRDDDDRGRGHDEDRDDRGDLLYVLNAGGPEAPICHLTPGTANTPNITGFRVDRAGHMNPIDESTQAIDPGNASNCTDSSSMGFSGLLGGVPAADFQCGLNPPSFPRSPAQVRFTPDGKRLVVTVKATNIIYVFRVDEDGRAGNPTTTPPSPPSTLPGPFGITFDKAGHLLVTELFGSSTSIPAGGRGAVSSFNITPNGHLQPISSHVSDGGGTAACWIALEPITGMFAYVANNLGTNGIASYKVANGNLTLLSPTAATPAPSLPNDLAVAVEGHVSFLYAVSPGDGTVRAFRINGATGSLTTLMGGGGFPSGSAPQGLAAF